MKSKNPNCGTGLSPCCDTNGYNEEIKKLKDDIQKVEVLLNKYKAEMALKVDTETLNAKTATITDGNITNIQSERVQTEIIGADLGWIKGLSTANITFNSKHHVALPNDDILIGVASTTNSKLIIDLASDRNENLYQTIIFERLGDNTFITASTAPVCTEKLNFYIDNIKKEYTVTLTPKKDTFTLPGEKINYTVASLLGEFDEDATVSSYPPAKFEFPIKLGINIIGDFSVYNYTELFIKKLAVDDLTLNNKLKLGNFLLEYPESTILTVPEGKTLHFWLRDGILKVKDSSMLLRFADYKVIEAIGDPKYILSRPNAPTNTNGILIKRADGKAFDISGKMAFYDTTGVQPIYFNVMDDVSAFEPVIISKDGIHYLGRKAGVGSFTANTIRAEELIDSPIVTTTDLTVDLIHGDVIEGHQAQIDNIATKELNYSNQVSSPNYDPTEFYYMKIPNFDSGIYQFKIYDLSNKEVAASCTIIRNKVKYANTVISYACDSNGSFDEVAEDEKGNLYFKLWYREKTISYGINTIRVNEKSVDPVFGLANEIPEGLIHIHDIKKTQHTIILGDGTGSYGIEIDGEVLATLIPQPGITSFEDLAISNTLSVGGESTFKDKVTIIDERVEKWTDF